VGGIGEKAIMRNTSFLSRAGYALIAVTALCGAMISTAAVADDEDPPGRVARVNLLDGRGAMEPAGTEEWVDDLQNRPLTGGDKIWIEAGARAEMHIGSTAVRLGARTALQILIVDDRRVRLRVTAGSVNVRIRALDDDRFIEVETPTIKARLDRRRGLAIASAALRAAWGSISRRNSNNSSSWARSMRGEVA